MSILLQQSRRRPVKSVLFVSGDGLRVVEDDTKVSERLQFGLVDNVYKVVCVMTCKT